MSDSSDNSSDQPLRILVVDDEQTVLRLLRSFLDSQNYRVQTANGGMEAIELVREKVFDLVLLDMKMPDLDGLETLKEMKRIDDTPSVLIMTAYGTIQTAVEAMKIGADDFLIKPLSLEALGILIERVREYRNLKEECRYLREQVSAEDVECQRVSCQIVKGWQVFRAGAADRGCFHCGYHARRSGSESQT